MKNEKKGYACFVYINMAEPSGEQFLQCLDKVEEWEPGTPREERPIHKAFELFDQEFSDTKNTVIIIDEIQESARVFNLVRTLAREFECYAIIIGSYLGRLLSKEFFLPAGDFEDLTMETLTFADFEDCLQMECAKSVGAQFIITRNLPDFRASTVAAISPDDFVRRYMIEES